MNQNTAIKTQSPTQKTPIVIYTPPPPLISCNSKKYSLVFFISLCFSAPLFALDFSPEGVFAGIGPEINGYARTSFSIGGALMLGIDLNDSFSTGIKAAFFDNFDTLSALETLLFFRYYLPFLHLPKNTDGPFAQLEAGSVVLFESGYHENLEAFPSFSGGFTAGWHFNFGENWYVEPSARIGYPYIWGAGLTAGIKFKNQNTNTAEQKKEIEPQAGVQIEEKKEEIIDEPITEEAKEETTNQIIIEVDESKFQVFPVIFRANHADFEGLSAETIENNYSAIGRIAEFLNKHENYKITIAGHANPTTPEGRARERERYSLNHLSEQRALKVLEELGKLGVSYSRMTVSGMGFSKMIFPYNDKENNWKNRRVEFILYMEKGCIE